MSGNPCKNFVAGYVAIYSYLLLHFPARALYIPAHCHAFLSGITMHPTPSTFSLAMFLHGPIEYEQVCLCPSKQNL